MAGFTAQRELPVVKEPAPTSCNMSRRWVDCFPNSTSCCGNAPTLTRTQTNRIEVKSDGLRVKSLALELPPGAILKTSTVATSTQPLTVKATQTGQRVELTLGKEVALNANDSITTKLEFA